ncbi:hypothetical protein PIB30_021989 [Stylosanthes scabra]|uniref:Uncharacterized protein n=1 Tax=Stylosanthes scabra TaxID=79078 RepID=A0ABU6W8W6_9FABA|nr:hypothetical protein [Stylosanthes scabra]
MDDQNGDSHLSEELLYLLGMGTDFSIESLFSKPTPTAQQGSQEDNTRVSIAEGPGSSSNRHGDSHGSRNRNMQAGGIGLLSFVVRADRANAKNQELIEKIMIVPTMPNPSHNASSSGAVPMQQAVETVLYAGSTSQQHQIPHTDEFGDLVVPDTPPEANNRVSKTCFSPLNMTFSSKDQHENGSRKPTNYWTTGIPKVTTQSASRNKRRHPLSESNRNDAEIAK